MPACPRHPASMLLGGGLVGAVTAAAAAVILVSGAPGAVASPPAQADRPSPGPAATSLEEVDRAILLLDEAWTRWTRGEALEEVAEWLAGQPDVEWAESLEGSLRFQARGAMPLGLVSGERIEAPRIELLPGADVETTPSPGGLQRPGSVRGGGGAARGAARRTTVVTDPGWGWGWGGWGGPSDEDWTPAEPVRVAQSSDDHVISDNSDFTVKPVKRALVLGLFDWEFGPLETAEVSAQIRVGREFTCDGCVEVRATDFERPVTINPSPNCVAEADGHCLPVQQTSWRDFLGWDDFDLIHVGTHGWQECRRDGSCYTVMATGRIGSRRQDIDGVTPETGAALRRLHRYDLIRSGVNVVPVGVEYHLVGSPTVCGDAEGAQTTRREERQGGVGDPFDYRVTDRATAAWDLLCQDGMLLETVTDRFFYIHYPEGLPDKLIVFSACEVFKDPGLARHLASRERSTIFGWTVPVDNTVGRKVMKHFYERLFPGFMAGGDEAAARGGGARAVVAWAEAVETHYRAIGPGPEVNFLARSPSRIPAPDSSDFVDKRPKELPYLVERWTNAEVQDGGRLELLGIPGDGRPDSLSLMVEVHGLAQETDLDRFEVGFRVDGELLPDTHPLTRPLSDEAWLFEGRVPLGRDARPGERVDLDVRVEIPGGGISRWLYEDLLLVGACSFTGRITEIRIQPPRARFLAAVGEYHGLAINYGDGALTFRIENRPDRDTSGGSPEVRSFTLVMRPVAPVGTLGPTPAHGGHVTIVRDNPHHDPRRTGDSTPIMNARFDSGTVRPRDPGEFNLHVFTDDRMAGSLRIPLELAGTQLLFEAEFDAGHFSTCGEL